MESKLVGNRPLKILMILHMPWNRNLGAGRVQLELAEEFQSLGHQVEKFDFHDAFPQYKPSRLTDLIRPSFSVKAKAFVQANAHHFDIIDAHHGDLPFTKQELGFKGLLVARSSGLYAFYDEFSKLDNLKNPPRKLKTRIGNFLRSWQHKQELSFAPRSLETSDLINLPNYDELAYVRDVLGLGDKCVVLPNGISEERLQKFNQAIKLPEVRLSNKQVAFIGSWGTRKGSKDWGEIITKVKSQVPSAKFLFLGTGITSEKVLEDLSLPACDWIKVIPKYDSAELPSLLSDATVGAFPSYIEGFGIAILEKLSSGLPTVAYDVPGPRAMLPLVDNSLMIPAGNIEQLSSRIVDLLSMNAESYSRLSKKCIEVANQFSWDVIAEQTLKAYYEFLELKK